MDKFTKKLYDKVLWYIIFIDNVVFIDENNKCVRRQIWMLADTLKKKIKQKQNF